MTTTKVQTLRDLMAAATPGPWSWNVNLKSKSLMLEGHPRRGRETVMAFARWGISGAQPLFCTDGLLVPASELTETVPGREHHESWFRTIRHRDADLICAAVNALPELVNGSEPSVANEIREWAEINAATLGEAHYRSLLACLERAVAKTQPQQL